LHRKGSVGYSLAVGKVSILLTASWAASSTSRQPAGSLRDQVMLSLGYGCGLRAREIVRLRDGDIDSAQMIIRIVQSKRAQGPARHAAGRVAAVAAAVVEGTPDTL
jgi:site-specific recombinase XerD